MPLDREDIGRSLIEAAELFRPRVYDDATGAEVVPGYKMIGHPTIAYGRALDIDGVTKAEGDMLLANSESGATTDAASILGAETWSKIDEVRAGALIDMAYNMGRTKLSGFHQMLAAIPVAIATGDWHAVHDQAIDSEWGRGPAWRRAARDAEIILTGVLPQKLTL